VPKIAELSNKESNFLKERVDLVKPVGPDEVDYFLNW
jgi:hypothetical protein